MNDLLARAEAAEAEVKWLTYALAEEHKRRETAEGVMLLMSHQKDELTEACMRLEEERDHIAARYNRQEERSYERLIETTRQLRADGDKCRDFAAQLMEQLAKRAALEPHSPIVVMYGGGNETAKDRTA